MGTVFQIISVILIIGAVFMFWAKISNETMITKGQRALAVFQIVLCGGFFDLCLSDVLDIKVNFSSVRLFLNLFYALAYLSLTAFVLSNLDQKKEKHIRIIICCCAALIAVQCFIFPYDAQSEFMRICQAIEGIAVYTLLIILVARIDDEKYGQTSLFVIVLLELTIAVLNTALPMASITEDIQSIDIPMNYASLYMRPVIFSSTALVYRIWLDKKNCQIKSER